MSAKLVGQALAAKGLHPTEKLILIGLADCTNTATGACFPSVAWLADEVAECSTRQVRRWLRSLEDRGWIETVSRPGTSSRYVVHTPDTDVRPPRASVSDHPGHTPDIAMSGTPDIAMSAEPEGTCRTAAVDDVDVPHHYCRPVSAFVDHPIGDCPECTPSDAATAAGGNQP
jgi:hypothetical protein